jgi:hypothetical protein
VFESQPRIPATLRLPWISSMPGYFNTKKIPNVFKILTITSVTHRTMSNKAITKTCAM